MNKVVVIGAGFGGLAAAAELARSGLEVTVLEANVYPGGSAGTFFHKGYRFDAGATLVGGFSSGAPMQLLGERLGIDWEERPINAAMAVHLPNGKKVMRWTEPTRWLEERRSSFGISSEVFWDWQESTAELMWDLAMRKPNWPPQSLNEAVLLSKTGIEWLGDHFDLFQTGWLAGIFAQAFQSVSSKLNSKNDDLRLFIDGQLLIASQATSKQVNALYGAAALDLPRRGVAQTPGGVGGMADKLVGAIRKFGGEVYYRQEVTGLTKNKDGTFLVKTRRKEEFVGDMVVFNLIQANITKIINRSEVKKLRLSTHIPEDGWGAFVLYAGITDNIIPPGFPNHHQVICSEPMGEGSSIFLSLSPEWDRTRAPDGKRAATISTHTRMDRWWYLYRKDWSEYEKRKEYYASKTLEAAENALPGIKSSLEILLPGTPVTFNRFTRRERGWVGGFPQTSLFRTRRARIGRGMWMVGDSIFPGQSVPAVALGGLSAAECILHEAMRYQKKFWQLPVANFYQLQNGD